MEYNEFEAIVQELGNIDQIKNLLHWDQEVQMPEKGVKARSKQLSALARIKHKTLSSEELAEKIKNLEQQDLKEEQKSVFREIKRQHKRARKVSTGLLQEIAEKESECLDTWKKAREEDDFSKVAPVLEDLIELKRRYAKQINPEEEPYKVLFADYEPYIKFDRMEKILNNARDELTEILDQIDNKGRKINKKAFSGEFSQEKQEEFNEKLIDLLGFDRERGKLNISEHPFTIGNQFDARITTRYNPEDISESIMPTIHEFGHALYFLGLEKENYGNPLGESRDFAVHESQSRLWENHIGRSKAFWKFLLPELKESFPEQMEDVSLQECFESINHYDSENLIRVHADEISYHLHIILRFELERKLINGEIEVEQLPELWNQKMEKYLYVQPETDKEGVLQDIHWFQGSIGYFPTYSLGSFMAAQIFQKADEEIEDLEKQIRNGEFEELKKWLKQEVHQPGKRFRTEKLIENVTGSKPSEKPFLKYIKDKYGEIYGIDL